MGPEKINYVKKGGKLGIAFFIAIAVVSLVSGDPSKIVYIAPASILVLGFMGGGSVGQIVFTVALIILVSLAPYYVVGAILGAIYEKSSNKLWTGRIITIVALLFIASFFYFASRPNYTSISQCESRISNLREGFDKPACYAAVAVGTGDISLCDLISLEDVSAPYIQDPQREMEYRKYQCYSRVGSVGDISLCSRIPEDPSVANGKGKIFKFECYSYGIGRNCEELLPNQREYDFCAISNSRIYGISDEELRSRCAKISDAALKRQCLSQDSSWLYGR